MKALEKDRTRRYETANGFAADVLRYLSGEPVQAHPPSIGHRLRKFVRRNRGQVIAASLVLLFLIGGIVGTSIGLAKAELARQAADRARDDEKAEREKAQRLADDNAKLAADENAAKQKAVEANEETARQLARVRAIMYTNQMAKAALLIDKQPTQALALLYDVEQCPIDLRDAAWNVAVQQCKRHLVSTSSIAAIGSSEIKTVSPNGTRCVSRNVRRDEGTGLSWVTLTLYEIPSGRLLATTPEFTDTPTNHSMRFSDDGSRLALVVNHDERFIPEKGLISSGVQTVYVCDVATGKLTAVKEMKGDPFRPPTLAIGAALLAIAGPDNTATLWDLASGKQKHVLKGHTASVSAFAFSADGARIATGGLDNAIKVWDVQSGQIQFAQEMPKDNPDPEFQAYKQELERRPNRSVVPIDGISALDFSLDGAALAAGNRNWLLEVWDLKKGERRTTLRGTKAAIGTAHFYADGKTILVNGLNRWDIATGQQLLALPTGSMGFANADRRLVVSTGIRSVDVFDPTATVAQRANMVVEQLKSPIPLVAFCGKNGQFVAVACDDRIELWDTRTGTPRKPLTGHKNPIAALAVSPDGRILASSSRQPRTNVAKADPEPGPKKEPQRDDVFLWDVEKGELIGVVPVNEVEVPSLAFSPDGKTLATIRWRGGVSQNVVVSVWDVATRRLRFDSAFTATEPLAFASAKVAFNPADGTLAAAAGNILRVWDLETRTFRELPSVGASGLSLVASLRYSPDGRTLALGVGDGRGSGEIGFFNVRTRETTGRLSGMGTSPHFTPDGKTIITQNRGKFHFWNPHTIQSLGSLDTGTFASANIVLSPDGQTLGTVSADPVGGRVTVQLWDLTRPPEVFPLASNISRFSPDSKTLMLTIAGSFQFLDLDTFRVRATVTTGRFGQGTDLSPDGRVLATTSGTLSRFSGVPVELFDTRTGLKIREIKPHAADAQVQYAGVAFSPDGKRLAVASLPPSGEKPAPDLHVTVALCQVADGKVATTIRVPFTDPNRNFVGGTARLAYSPDGTAILLSSAGGAATVIELTDPPRLVSLPSPKEVAGDPRLSVLAAVRFTSDGTHIVGRYGTFPGKQPVVMWDRHTGELVDGPIPDVLPNPDNFVRVSPDGQYEVRPNLHTPGRPSVLIDRRVKPPELLSPPSPP